MPAPLAMFSPLAITKSTARSVAEAREPAQDRVPPGLPEHVADEQDPHESSVPIAGGTVTPHRRSRRHPPAVSREDQPDSDLGGVEQRFREEAEGEHARRRQADGGEAPRSTGPGLSGRVRARHARRPVAKGRRELVRRPARLLILRLAEVHVPDDAQVVEGRHGAHDHGNDGQPGVAGLTTAVKR